MIARDQNLEQLTIYSDSNYVIQGVTEWIFKWKENGWKTAGGEDVKNKDLWMELAGLTQEIRTKIEWKHVAAHSGISGNEEADKLAVQGAKRMIVETKQSDNLPRIACNTTPNRKSNLDRSNTPVPGSMNGSCVIAQAKPASPHDEGKSKGKTKCTSDINVSTDNLQTLKIMTNMETILATVITELHEIKENQIQFKNEIQQEIRAIKDRQQDDGKCLSILSKELKKDIGSCVVNIESLMRDRVTSNSNEDVKAVILNLQKKVDSRLDLTNSNIEQLETSVSSTKTSMEKLSRECATELKTLESKNSKITEALVGIQTDIKRTTHTLADVEKSMTSLSEKDEFTRPPRAARERMCNTDTTPAVDNRFEELVEESDDEVIFKGTEPVKNSDNSKSADTNVLETHSEKKTLQKSSNNKETPNQDEGKTVAEKPKTHTRKEMVYLVGDSISGQVNPAILGKSTGTYVKKLKASKIEDLHALTDQMKDAKMIIIHTGINNLRAKESTIDSGKTLIESIAAFREAAPESKIVVSKIIPIGDHEIDIDRNLLNAENEKRLTEINKSEIGFIDHGNLSDRGIPIKEYYRPVLIHLSGHGVAVLAKNIEKEIIRVLKTGEQQSKAVSETSYSTQPNCVREANRREILAIYIVDPIYKHRMEMSSTTDIAHTVGTVIRGVQTIMLHTLGIHLDITTETKDTIVGTTRDVFTGMMTERMTDNIIDVIITKTIKDTSHRQHSVVEII